MSDIFHPSALLIAALCAVESNNQIAAQRGGHWGILQISERYVRDVNEYRVLQAHAGGYHATEFRHRDAFRRESAIQMFKDYSARYCRFDLLGHEPSDKDAALIHRFGPTGAWEPRNAGAAIEYWARVAATMEGLRGQYPELYEREAATP